MKNPKKICQNCNRQRTTAVYYKSKSPYHADGLLPICKDCCIDLSLDDDGAEFDLEHFKRLLRLVDKPYIESVYQSAASEVGKRYPEKRGSAWVQCFIGKYIKNLNSYSQFMFRTWEDSDGMRAARQAQQTQQTEAVYIDPITESGELSDFAGTQKGYALALYKYLLDEYPQLTDQQKELLRRFVRECTFLQMEFAHNDYEWISELKDAISALAALKRSIGGVENEETAMLLECIDLDGLDDD